MTNQTEAVQAGTEITTPMLVARYVELRDALAQLKTAYDAKRDVLVDAQDAISTELDLRMNQAGLSSMKTDSGTVSRKMTRKIAMRDSGEFMRFIRAKGLPELLQARVSSTAVEDYVRDGNQLPDGLGYDDAITISVRR